MVSALISIKKGSYADRWESILSFNFWVLVVARGVVGIGSGGMGYMVTLILTGECLDVLHDLLSSSRLIRI